MKRIIGVTVLFLVAVSVLFKGLFFPLEMYIFFAVIMALSLAYFTVKLVRREQLNLSGWLSILSLLLLAAYAISFSTAVYPRGNIGTLIQYTMYFIVSIVVYDLMKDMGGKSLQFLLIPAAVTGFVVAVIGLEGYTKAFPVLYDTIFTERLGSVFQYTNTAAIYLLMIYVLTLTLMISSGSVLLRTLSAGAANIVLLALFYTGSRGGYVFALVAIILFLIVTPRVKKLQCLAYMILTAAPLGLSIKGFGANAAIANYISATKWMALSFAVSAMLVLVAALLQKMKPGIQRNIIALSSAFIVIIAAGIALYRKLASGSIGVLVSNMVPGKIVDRLTTINVHETNFTARLDMDKDALQLIHGHWLTGYGGGGWAALYQTVQDYYYTARAVHDHYLQVFVESGIMGFIAFTLLAAAACFIFLRILLKSTDVKQRIYASGIFTAFFALSAHSLMDFNLIYSSLALTWWCFLAIAAYWYSSGKEGSGPILRSIAVKGRVVSIVFVAACAIIIFFSVKYAAGAWYESAAEECRERPNLKGAIAAYEKASSFDGMNAAYDSSLAELYNQMATNSKKTDEVERWRKMAINAGEKSVSLDPDYPYYNYVLTQTYFDAEMSVEAYRQTEKLVRLQPMSQDNYELLARGYMDAGLKYYQDKDVSKARELIQKCADMDKIANAPRSQTMAFYRGKALLLMKKYDEAEELLNFARNGPLDLKLESDRLLYIINQETGRDAANEKYKGLIWMGMVEETSTYKLTKEIINDTNFQK